MLFVKFKKKIFFSKKKYFVLTFFNGLLHYNGTAYEAAQCSDPDPNLRQILVPGSNCNVLGSTSLVHTN